MELLWFHSALVVSLVSFTYVSYLSIEPSKIHTFIGCTLVAMFGVMCAACMARSASWTLDWSNRLGYLLVFLSSDYFIKLVLWFLQSSSRQDRLYPYSNFNLTTTTLLAPGADIDRAASDVAYALGGGWTVSWGSLQDRYRVYAAYQCAFCAIAACYAFGIFKIKSIGAFTWLAWLIFMAAVIYELHGPVLGSLVGGRLELAAKVCLLFVTVVMTLYVSLKARALLRANVTSTNSRLLCVFGLLGVLINYASVTALLRLLFVHLLPYPLLWTRLILATIGAIP